MRKFMCVLLSTAMIMSGNARGDTSTTQNPKAAKTKKCFFPKSKKRAPVWLCSAKVDGLAVTAVGSAAKSQAGLAFMEQMASADARAQLARSLHGTGQKNSASGTDAASSSEEILTGTKIVKRAYAPDGSLYVLMGLDEIDAQKLREASHANGLGQKNKE